MPTRRRAELMLLLVTVCWGVSFPAIKSATPYVSAGLFVAVRFTVATLLLLAGWSVVAHRRGDPPPLAELRRPAARRWGALLGLLIAAGYTTQTVGMHTTSAQNSAFITALSVVLVPLVVFLLHGVRPGREVVAGIALAVAGLALMTRPDLGGMRAGDLWTLACALSYAFYIERLDRALRAAPYLPLLWWSLAVCAVATGLWAALWERRLWEWNGTLGLSLTVTVLLSTLLALYLQNRYQGRTTPSRAALLFAAEPVFAALCAWWWLGERLDRWAVAGAGLILAAVLVTELGAAPGAVAEPGGRA